MSIQLENAKKMIGKKLEGMIGYSGIHVTCTCVDIKMYNELDIVYVCRTADDEEYLFFGDEIAMINEQHQS